MNTLLRLVFLPWIFLIPIIVLLFLIAPILIGIVVYKDALRKHVQSPAVWAIIAALVPFYIGLLLYAVIGVTQTDNSPRP